MIKNIVFAGTPEIAAKLLQDLLMHEHINIIACYTQPDRPKGRNKQLTPSPVKQVTIKHNIKLLQPITLKHPDAVVNLQQLQPDLMIVFAYGLILPQSILDIPKYGCFNIHTSLLPKWRGAAPIQHAILAGDQVTGINIIKMDAGLDTGDIYHSMSCPITPHDTAASLAAKLQPLATTAILKVINQLNTNQYTAIPQDHSAATYAHKINKADAKIDWSLPAAVIDRKIRAMIPAPIAFTQLGESVIRIWQASIASLSTNQLDEQQPHQSIPGTIININKHGIDVTTGDGIIKLTKIQLPGSKVLAIADIINGKKYLDLFDQQNLKFL